VIDGAVTEVSGVDWPALERERDRRPGLFAGADFEVLAFGTTRFFDKKWPEK